MKPALCCLLCLISILCCLLSWRTPRDNPPTWKVFTYRALTRYNWCAYRNGRLVLYNSRPWFADPVDARQEGQRCVDDRATLFPGIDGEPVQVDAWIGVSYLPGPFDRKENKP